MLLPKEALSNGIIADPVYCKRLKLHNPITHCGDLAPPRSHYPEKLQYVKGPDWCEMSSI